MIRFVEIVISYYHSSALAHWCGFGQTNPLHTNVRDLARQVVRFVEGLLRSYTRFNTLDDEMCVVE